MLFFIVNIGKCESDQSNFHKCIKPCTQAYLGYCVTHSNCGLLPQDASLRHPGLPGVLRHSFKLRTSTPGYIAETSRPTWGIASLIQTTDFYPRIHRWEGVVSGGVCGCITKEFLINRPRPCCELIKCNIKPLVVFKYLVSGHCKNMQFE
jgi:hypothetical protein